MKQEDKDKLKSTGKKIGKTAWGITKAWAHVSISMAQGALDSTIGGDRSASARHQMDKAIGAIKDIGRETPKKLKPSDIPDC